MSATSEQIGLDGSPHGFAMTCGRCERKQPKPNIRPLAPRAPPKAPFSNALARSAGLPPAIAEPIAAPEPNTQRAKANAYRNAADTGGAQSCRSSHFQNPRRLSPPRGSPVSGRLKRPFGSTGLTGVAFRVEVGVLPRAGGALLGEAADVGVRSSGPRGGTCRWGSWWPSAKRYGWGRSDFLVVRRG